ncbi:uncharacterized protein [Magallana gigas]|uniref:uncharacterized protein n=1 Tax=Magallana gigas TaxID=29159 RepID=UPI003340F67C
MVIFHLMIVAFFCKTAVAKVVDCKCVYEKNGKITNAVFNLATQICCPKAGVRDRFELGLEMDCCGEIAKKTMRNRTHICCKSSGVHERYQENEEVDCCADGVYKRHTGQCTQKDVKTACGNNSEISQRRKDSTKSSRSRIFLPLNPQCRNEVVTLFTERFGKNGKKIQKAIGRLGKALGGKSNPKKPLIIIYL